jgi:hypothetical protein
LLLPGGGGRRAADALDARPVPEAVQAQAHRRRRIAEASCRRRRQHRRGFLLHQWLAGLLLRLVGCKADGQVEVDVEVPPRRRRRCWSGGARLVVAAAAAGLRRVRDDIEMVLLVVSGRGAGDVQLRRLQLVMLLLPRRAAAGGADRPVRLRVDAAGDELALDVRVPIVLDLVVRPARQPPGDQRPPEMVKEDIYK